METAFLAITVLSVSMLFSAMFALVGAVAGRNSSRRH